jgi:hypothetical protein
MAAAFQFHLRWITFCTPLLAAGCMDSADLLLKAPVNAGCAKVGLRGCDEMTEGVLLYVQGDKSNAETKLKEGAAENAPAQVRAFAGQLRLLKSVPGVEQYVGPLMEVADLLAPEHEREKEHGQPVDSDRRERRAVTQVALSTDDGPAEARPPLEVRRVAGVAIPAADTRAYTCLLFTDMPWESDSTAARCVKLAQGAMVVTDVQTTGACHDTLVIGAGDPMSPRWMFVGEPSLTVSVHGAHYPVNPDEALFVAQVAEKPENLVHNVSCSIAWAAERAPAPRSPASNDSRERASE